MVSRLFFLFLVVSLHQINASISLSVISGENDKVAVKHKGMNVKIVTQADLSLFNVPMSKLSNAVESHFGRAPDHIFLAESVPWGHIHQDYCWEPVTIVSNVKNATVRKVNNEPVVLATHDFDNESNQTIKTKAGISQSIANTIKSSWSYNQALAASLEVEYKVSMFFAKASGYAGFSTSLSWGKTEEKSETESAGASSQIEMELKPGKSATAVLSANRGSIEVDVVYEATLRGILVVSFADPYNGHYYWGVPIEKVLSRYGLSNKAKTVSSLDVGFFTNIKTRVLDKKTGMLY